jgi:hypothetical protein
MEPENGQPPPEQGKVDPLAYQGPKFTFRSPATEAEEDRFLADMDAKLGLEVEPQPAPEKSSGAPPEPAAKSAAPPDPDVERALGALRRAKVPRPETLVDAIGKEAFLSWAKELEEQQAEIDRAFTAKAQLEKLGSKDGEKLKEPAAVPPRESPKRADLDASLKPFVDELGPEAGAALRGILEAERGAADTALAARDEQLAAMAGEFQRALLEIQRVRLAMKLPDLLEDEPWAKVRERAAAIAALDEWKGMDADKAIGLILARAAEQAGLKTKAQKDSERAAERARDAGGRFTPGQRGPQESSEPLTDDQRDDMYLAAMDRGASAEELKRIAALPVQRQNKGRMFAR